MNFSTFKNQPKKIPIGKGLIAIIAADHSRYSKFWCAFLSLTRSMPSVDIEFYIGLQFVQSRNSAVKDAIAGGYDWLWFIDDDHDFTPDVLLRLLANDVDICGPLYCVRGYPFHPTARRLNDNNNHRQVFNVVASGPPGLHEVLGTGTSGLLIKRRVLTTMSYPWFACGHLNPDQISEDFYFCDKAREHGFKIHLDTRIILEHFTIVKSSLQWIDGEWKVMIDCGQDFIIPLTYNMKEAK